MQQETKPLSQKGSWPVVPGVLLLAFLLVASIWATRFFSAEARVGRASARVVRWVEKPGEESPVSLGLAANRLGKVLSTNAVLELDGYGALATGRQEIVQLFAQIRASLGIVAFEHLEIAAVAAGRGAVTARVVARYRLVPEGGEAAEGNGTAELLWIKGKDGWQISRAVLRAEEGASLPNGWK